MVAELLPGDGRTDTWRSWWAHIWKFIPSASKTDYQPQKQ